MVLELEMELFLARVQSVRRCGRLSLSTNVDTYQLLVRCDSSEHETSRSERKKLDLTSCT